MVGCGRSVAAASYPWTPRRTCVRGNSRGAAQGCANARRCWNAPTPRSGKFGGGKERTGTHPPSPLSLRFGEQAAPAGEARQFFFYALFLGTWAVPKMCSLTHHRETIFWSPFFGSAWASHISTVVCSGRLMGANTKSLAQGTICPKNYVHTEVGAHPT